MEQSQCITPLPPSIHPSSSFQPSILPHPSILPSFLFLILPSFLFLHPYFHPLPRQCSYSSILFLVNPLSFSSLLLIVLCLLLLLRISAFLVSTHTNNIIGFHPIYSIPFLSLSPMLPPSSSSFIIILLYLSPSLSTFALLSFSSLSRHYQAILNSEHNLLRPWCVSHYIASSAAREGLLFK